MPAICVSLVSLVLTVLVAWMARSQRRLLLAKYQGDLRQLAVLADAVAQSRAYRPGTSALLRMYPDFDFTVDGRFSDLVDTAAIDQELP